MKLQIKDFFDKNYSSMEHYWWKADNRFSLEESQHTQYYAAILHEAKALKNGLALDIGAGEGIDAIRLALLGLTVEAIELSPVGVEKIQRFADQAGVYIKTTCADIIDYSYINSYDIILCNGVLHYIKNKEDVITKMQQHTKIGGLNCISLFSTFTDVPECHRIVSVYPDNEGGLVERMYHDWEIVYKSYDRNKAELSHDEMPSHTHSFIKLICRRIK